MMKKFGKTNVLAFLAVMSFGLLASCSQGNDNNPDKWAQDAIAMAEDSVEKVDNEMVGKLLYIDNCRQFARKAIDDKISDTYKEMEEKVKDKSDEEKWELFKGSELTSTPPSPRWTNTTIRSLKKRKRSSSASR